MADHHFQPSGIRMLGENRLQTPRELATSHIHSVPGEPMSSPKEGDQQNQAKISESAKPECAKWRSDIVNISNIGY